MKKEKRKVEGGVRVCVCGGGRRDKEGEKGAEERREREGRREQKRGKKSGENERK